MLKTNPNGSSARCGQKGKIGSTLIIACVFVSTMMSHILEATLSNFIYYQPLTPKYSTLPMLLLDPMMSAMISVIKDFTKVHINIGSQTEIVFSLYKVRQLLFHENRRF